MDLHRAIGHPPAHLGGKELRARRLGTHIVAIVAKARGVEHHGARGIDLGLAVGEHRLHELKLGDRLAELLALDRVTQRIGEHALGGADADRRDVQPALVEHLHRRLEAHAFAATDMVKAAGYRVGRACCTGIAHTSTDVFALRAIMVPNDLTNFQKYLGAR